MPTINKKPLILNRSEGKRGERQKLYQNPQWRKISKLFRQQNPLCSMCLENDIVTPAKAVHHVLSPFDSNISEVEKYRRLLDWNNLVSLCNQCHQKLHDEQEKEKKNKKKITQKG